MFKRRVGGIDQCGTDWRKKGEIQDNRIENFYSLIIILTLLWILKDWKIRVQNVLCLLVLKMINDSIRAKMFLNFLIVINEWTIYMRRKWNNNPSLSLIQFIFYFIVVSVNNCSLSFNSWKYLFEHFKVRKKTILEISFPRTLAQLLIGKLLISVHRIFIG